MPTRSWTSRSRPKRPQADPTDLTNTSSREPKRSRLCFARFRSAARLRARRGEGSVVRGGITSHTAGGRRCHRIFCQRTLALSSMGPLTILPIPPAKNRDVEPSSIRFYARSLTGRFFVRLPTQAPATRHVRIHSADTPAVRHSRWTLCFNCCDASWLHRRTAPAVWRVRRKISVICGAACESFLHVARKSRRRHEIELDLCAAALTLEPLFSHFRALSAFRR